MNAIIDFFTSFIDIIVSLIQLVVSLVKAILWFVVNLPQLIAGITSSFGFAPSFLLPYLLFSLALFVLIFIIRLL